MLNREKHFLSQFTNNWTEVHVNTYGQDQSWIPGQTPSLVFCIKLHFLSRWTQHIKTPFSRAGTQSYCFIFIFLSFVEASLACARGLSCPKSTQPKDSSSGRVEGGSVHPSELSACVTTLIAASHSLLSLPLGVLPFSPALSIRECY